MACSGNWFGQLRFWQFNLKSKFEIEHQLESLKIASVE